MAWISVKKQLPFADPRSFFSWRSKPCLVSNHGDLFIARLTNSEFKYEEKNLRWHDGATFRNHITHWQYLPEPPDFDEGNEHD